MAVGVVVLEAVFDPEDLVHGEAVGDGLVERRVVASGGAVRVVLHALGGEQESVAGDLDAAAFEFEVVGELAQAE